MPYYFKRVKTKRKRFTKSALKLYLWLTILCFLLAAGFSFLSGKVPTLVREKVDDALVAEAEKTLGRKLKTSDLDLIEKTLGIKIDPASLGRGGKENFKGYKGTSDDFLKKLKKAYKGKISPADLEKARKAFKTGQVDPADIERAKRAYKRGMIKQGSVEKGKKAFNR